jgi:pyruvate dehydrogenase E2 component (dihydrolipoyllysine-residue acetyltransferase)
MGLFVMPSLGADMEEGKLVEWLIKPGDTVARGDVVAVVETQKGAIEIEIFEAGVVTALEARPGQTLPVGAPLARIDMPAKAEADPESPTAPVEIPPEPLVETPSVPTPEIPDAPPVETPDVPPPEMPPDSSQKFTPRWPAPASPAARMRAGDVGLSLASLHGSGPDGAILLADVDRQLEATVEKPTQPRIDMDEMRKAISAAMIRSKREIPHYYLAQPIDLQPATDWLAETNANRPPDNRLLMGALFLRATVRALAKTPELNGIFAENRFIPSTTVHAGLVVALRGGGLIAPAIRDAETLALDEIMVAIRDIVARARNGRLRNSELTTGSITVSNMGETGAGSLYGVIYPPQVALVGFGAPMRRAWVVGDAVVPRNTVTVTLAADHRVSDGRKGAQLLTGIERLLTEPATL